MDLFYIPARVVFRIGVRTLASIVTDLGNSATEGPRPPYFAGPQREELYKDFIEEASRLYADALMLTNRRFQSSLTCIRSSRG
jgi:hypothetical protein